MTTLLRRFLVVIALMFWQGGFTFYVSVVVPMGTAVLRSTVHQGFITRKVTVWMNLTGAVVLVVLLVELVASRSESGAGWRRWLRIVAWLIMACSQGLLFWLHGYLDSLMVERGRIVLDPEVFYPAHRVYLWAHTVQWFAGLVFVGLTLRTWQMEDRERGGKAEQG